ncbi:MAG: hypothetical protein EOQ89_34830, partial [Mesorhizobium sp.]
DPNRVVVAGMTFKAGDQAGYSYEADPAVTGLIMLIVSCFVTGISRRKLALATHPVARMSGPQLAAEADQWLRHPGSCPPENKIRPRKPEKAIQQHATLSVA